MTVMLQTADGLEVSDDHSIPTNDAQHDAKLGMPTATTHPRMSAHAIAPQTIGTCNRPTDYWHKLLRYSAERIWY